MPSETITASPAPTGLTERQLTKFASLSATFPSHSSTRILRVAHRVDFDLKKANTILENESQSLRSLTSAENRFFFLIDDEFKALSITELLQGCKKGGWRQENVRTILAEWEANFKKEEAKGVETPVVPGGGERTPKKKNKRGKRRNGTEGASDAVDLTPSNTPTRTPSQKTRKASKTATTPAGTQTALATPFSGSPTSSFYPSPRTPFSPSQLPPRPHNPTPNAAKGTKLTRQISLTSPNHIPPSQNFTPTTPSDINDILIPTFNTLHSSLSSYALTIQIAAATEITNLNAQIVKLENELKMYKTNDAQSVMALADRVELGELRKMKEVIGGVKLKANNMTEKEMEELEELRQMKEVVVFLGARERERRRKMERGLCGQHEEVSELRSLGEAVIYLAGGGGNDQEKVGDGEAELLRGGDEDSLKYKEGWKEVDNLMEEYSEEGGEGGKYL